MKSEGSVIIGAQCDQGRVRDSNEDRSFYCKIDLRGLADGDTGVLAVVADGMGGHAAGEAASEKAIQVLQSRFSGPSLAGLRETSSSDWESFIAEGVHQANLEVYEEARRWEGRSGMGTTLTAAVVIDDSLYLGHVGDSRAYLIRRGSITQLTEDDTWTADRVRKGLMTAEEASGSERAGQLLRALGIKETVQVYTTSMKLQPGDAVLLCTDGLTGVVADAEILRIIRKAGTPQSACRRLVALANRKGGPDNIAVMALSYKPELTQRQAVVSPRTARRAMIAGLIAVLALLAVDAAYIALHYSEVPQPPASTSVRSLTSPVTVTEKTVPAPDRTELGQTSTGTPEPGLTIRDMSGEVITLPSGGDR